MRISSLLLLCFMLSVFGKSQNVDSLERALTSANDTQTVQIYYKLLRAYEYSEPEKSLDFAQKNSETILSIKNLITVQGTILILESFLKI